MGACHWNPVHVHGSLNAAAAAAEEVVAASSYCVHSEHHYPPCYSRPYYPHWDVLAIGLVDDVAAAAVDERVVVAAVGYNHYEHFVHHLHYCHNLLRAICLVDDIAAAAAAVIAAAAVAAVGGCSYFSLI